MTRECSHEAAIRDVTPSALGCEEFENPLALAASAPLPNMRACRML
jgi:hypothetical protein